MPRAGRTRRPAWPSDSRPGPSIPPPTIPERAGPGRRCVVTPMQELFESLRRRRRPEDVAEFVRELLGGRLSAAEGVLLEKAAQGALARRPWGSTSMAEDFARPVGLARQVNVSAPASPAAAPGAAACDDPTVLTPYVADASRVIAKTPGRSDFQSDRLDRGGRRAAGLGELSRRQYNKRFRLLARIEHKLATLKREIHKREAHADLEVAPGLAAWLGRLLRRRQRRLLHRLPGGAGRPASVFTCGQQKRAYDAIADMLSPIAGLPRRPTGGPWPTSTPIRTCWPGSPTGRRPRCPPRSASCKGFRKCSFYPGRSRNSTGGP